MSKLKFVVTVAMVLAATSPASAGPLACVGASIGGGVLAIASLFTGPGIFVTAPTIFAGVGLACVAPTP